MQKLKIVEISCTGCKICVTLQRKSFRNIIFYFNYSFISHPYMKKLYSFIVATLLGICGVQAQDVTFTIDFDDASAVTVTYNYDQPYEVHDGVNTFTASMYESYQITVKSGYAFASITDQNGTVQSVYSGVWYVSIYDKDQWNGKAFTVKTINLDASRDASFSMTIDNTTNLLAMLGGTSSSIELFEGTHEYKFNSEVETELYLSTYASKPIYRVELDGVALDQSDLWTMTIPLTPGCNINVINTYPDMPAVINVVYDEEANPGLLKSVSLNYENSVAWDGKPIDCQVGDNVSLILDTQKYKVEEVVINGVSQDLTYFYGTVNFTPTAAENTVEIKAHAFGNITAYVTIDHPEAIKLYAGYYGVEDYRVNLVEGRNKVEVPENANVLSWVANSGYEIVKVLNGDGVELFNNSVYATEGMELYFETKAFVLDQDFVFYVDDPTAAMYYFRLTNSRRDDYDIEAGYNLIPFTESFNPFELSFAGAPMGQTYLNGELVPPMYEGGTYWNLNINNGDVVKCFLKNVPVECPVTVNCEGEGEVTFTRDLIDVVADWQKGFTCFAGTQVVIAPNETTECELYVNNFIYRPDEAGAYTVEITEATTLDMKLTSKSGINDVTVDNEGDNTIYNLQGIKVGESTSTLPAGLYIRGGVKVVVK